MSRDRGTTLWVAAVTGLVALGTVGPNVAVSQVAAPAVSAKSEAAGDPLFALNEASRAAYRRAKESALAKAGPVLLVEGDNLVLKRRGERIEVRFTPDLYHTLKTVAHIPLALDVMVTSAGDDGQLDASGLDELRRYRDLIVRARERLDAIELKKETSQRQSKIVAASLEFLDSVAEARACRAAERIAYTRRMAPLVLANADEAAGAALDSLHKLVGQWMERMSAAEWERLIVVVMGRQLPRQENLAVQYFARRLREPGEGARIVYAEALFDEPKALDLLATRLVDTGVGVDFFDDPRRMYRDLLGDAAKVHLPRLFGGPARASDDRGRNAPAAPQGRITVPSRLRVEPQR